MQANSSAISVRFRIDFGGACSVGFGKISLLEAIARTGSISNAACELGMSRRRAATLINSMNASFDQPIVAVSANGRSASITAFGAHVIASLRSFDSLLAPLAAEHLRDLALHVRTDR